MKKILFIILFYSTLSCSKKINELRTIDLSKKEIKFKVGPLWIENESEIDFVFGLNTNKINNDFITELHFNFGGHTKCNYTQINLNLDFNSNKNLILSDSINKLIPESKVLIKRINRNNKINFEYKNPKPGILIFTIEKINLKPNGIKNEILLNLNSNCIQNFVLPLSLIKYNVKNIDELYEKYINLELSKINVNKLINKKIILSFNEIHKEGKYLIDLVDQSNMLILSYDKVTNEYLLHDIEKKLITKIKR
jgi:hypothetical protein